jgi:hypothetical protein
VTRRSSLDPDRHDTEASHAAAPRVNRELGSRGLGRSIRKALMVGSLEVPRSGPTQQRQALQALLDCGGAELRRVISRQPRPTTTPAEERGRSARTGAVHLELRAHLQMRLAEEDVAEIETRRRTLEALFRSLDSGASFDLMQRLATRLSGDELSVLFHDELATPTREHLIRLLHRRMTTEARIPSLGPPEPGRYPCAAGQAILIDERGNAHCLDPTDEWFDSRYVDHEIVHAIAFPDAEQAVERILSGQDPGYERRHLTLFYAGGRAVTIELDRVATGGPPLGVRPKEDEPGFPSTGTARGAQLRYKPRRFVMRKGIIFPDPETYDPGSTPNIVVIAAAAKEEFEARRVFLKTAVLVAPFASSISALGGFHGQVRDTVSQLNRVVVQHEPGARGGSGRPRVDPEIDEIVDQAFKGLGKDGGDGGGPGGGSGGTGGIRSGIGVRVPATTGPSLAVKHPYQPRKGATASENAVGELLQRKLSDEAVYGSPEQFPGMPSGDYRFVSREGRVTSADLFEPNSASVGSVVANVIKKGSQPDFPQAEIVVVRFGNGDTADMGVDAARQIARDVFATPNHDVSRLIFVKGGEILLDTKDTL